jgi:hypothetical protein
MAMNHESTDRLQRGLQPNAATDVGERNRSPTAGGETMVYLLPQKRNAKGRYEKVAENEIGNATTHALYVQTPASLAQLRADVDAIMRGYLVDEGERDLIDVPVRRRQQLENRARVERRIRQLDEALELRGVLDRRGKLRQQWLTMLCSLIDRARALDQLLGLQRRERDSLDSMTPEQWVAREERRRQQDVVGSE